jgi:hypothetical protein
MPATRSSISARGDSSADQILASTSHHETAIPGLAVGTPRATKVKEEPVTPELKPVKKVRSLGWQKDNRPPRPANAFISFKSSLKEGPLKREYARRLASGENIGVVAQQMWKNLSQDERDVWYAEARKAKEEHAKKYPGYKYQPRRRGEKTRRKSNVAEEEEEEEEEEGLSEDAGPVLVEEPVVVAVTPTSSKSEEVDTDIHGEPRTVEVYMGGTEDLDTLYKNGWKVGLSWMHPIFPD